MVHGDAGHIIGIPLSAADELLSRLAAASVASAAAGRPFTALCSLVDHSFVLYSLLNPVFSPLSFYIIIAIYFISL